MVKSKKKIIVLLAGGTLLINKHNRILSVQAPEDIPGWLEEMPELKILAEVEPIFVCSEDEILTAKIWQNMAQVIWKQKDRADGFVVVARPEQLVHTSLALGFLLQNFGKSIVATSAQVGGTDFGDKRAVIAQLKNEQGGLGLRSNLINAVQVALQSLPGPAIMFGTRLIPAVKAVPNPADSINPLVSLDNTYWGKVDFGVSLKAGLGRVGSGVKIFTNLSPDVFILEDVPGLAWKLTKKDLLAYQAILIRVNTKYPLPLEKQQQIGAWGMPVVLYGHTSPVSISGAVALFDCTWHTALIKTMWAAANFKNLPDFVKAMKQNIIGEFVA